MSIDPALGHGSRNPGQRRPHPTHLRVHGRTPRPAIFQHPRNPRLPRQKRRHWVVAEDDTIIVCAIISLQPTSVYIGRVAIEPIHRGRGLERAFVETATTIAFQHDLYLLELRVRIFLPENIAAFTAMGFVKTAEHWHPGYDRPTFITTQKGV